MQACERLIFEDIFEQLFRSFGFSDRLTSFPLYSSFANDNRILRQTISSFLNDLECASFVNDNASQENIDKSQDEPNCIQEASHRKYIGINLRFFESIDFEETSVIRMHFNFLSIFLYFELNEKVIFKQKRWRNYDHPEPIARSFMNSFTIEEDYQFELIKIYEFEIWYAEDWEGKVHDAVEEYIRNKHKGK